MNTEFDSDSDITPANNPDYFDFIDKLTPSTLRLLEVASKIPDNLETPDQAATYLVETVAPVLQDALLQPEQQQSQADAVAIGQTLMAVLSLSMSVGQSRGTTDVAGALSALVGNR